ncbi:EFR1 family ferrodoxin [Clostridiaceae bacterium HSG29]|nr:EFR1 family ferrodoxin [Clostridiaceae bacterium HSG29]
MYTIVQFSPTGNTAYLAGMLSEYLDVDRVNALEHTIPSKLKESEHLIILFAIHAFNAPKTVKRFVKGLPSDRFTKISLIAVGCNDKWLNCAASNEIRKILEKKAYQIVVDEIIAMPLTLIMSFPEEMISNLLMDARKRINKISIDIKNSIVSKKKLPFKSLLVNRVGRIEPFAARFFGLELYAKKSCIKCGLCVRECPESNIHMKDNGKIKFGFKCMMCMRCIYNCPTKSIIPRISKFIPIKNGYSIERYISGGAEND